MKAREIRLLLGNQGIDPKIITVLCNLAEEQSEMKQKIAECIQMVEKLVDTYGLHSRVLGRMKEKLEEYDRKFGTDTSDLIGDAEGEA